MKSTSLQARKSVLVVLMVFLLYSCASPIAESSHATIPAQRESPETPPPALQKSTGTPNPTPTFDIIAIIPAWTPADNLTGAPVERWVQYETAFLAACDSHAPLLAEKLCEWDIIAMRDNAVYVWAFCIDNQGRGSSGRVVVYLNSNGRMEKVLCPRTFDESKAIFPPDIFEQYRTNDFDLDKYWRHIELRFDDRSIPPLIVVEGTPLP